MYERMYKWHIMYEKEECKKILFCPYDVILVNCKPNKITLQLYVHKHVDKFTPEFLKNL